jgi:hypothetical protein
MTLLDNSLSLFGLPARKIIILYFQWSFLLLSHSSYLISLRLSRYMFWDIVRDSLAGLIVLFNGISSIFYQKFRCPLVIIGMVRV